MMFENIDTDRLVGTFLKYAAVNSPRLHERVMADLLEPELRALGFDITYDNARETIGGNCSNLFATRKGSVENAFCLGLSAHLDTVQPTEKWGYIRDADVISAAGESVLGADDKAGLAAIMEALRIVQEHDIPCGDIQIIFSVAEEQGLQGARNMDIDMIHADAIYVFDVGEPVGMIYLAAPSHSEIKATFKGRGSHAGMCPENGISSILAAGQAITRMKLGRIDDETTANIGIISGGNAVNAIPEICTINGEARSIDNKKLRDQLDHMRRCCESAASELGITVDFTNIDWYGGYRLDPDIEAVKIACKAVSSAGLDIQMGSTGGGSDANIFNTKGIPSVPIGIGYRNAHSVRESISVTDLVMSSRIALGLIIESSRCVH